MTIATASLGPDKVPGAALNLPLAIFLATATAFAAYAMPADTFSGLVEATGLPAILPAAQAPLGQTARVAFIAVASLLALAGAWGLLSAIDRIEAREPEELPEIPAVPRIRRADAHPDAPSRRPLSAADLGEPLPRAAPRGVAPASTPAPSAAPEESEEEEELELAEMARFPSFLEPVQPEAANEDEEEEAPLDLTDEAAEPAAAEPLDFGAVAARIALPQDDPSQNVGRLMQRLEAGLQRRSGSPAQEASRPAAAPAPGGPAGHRLRSAIGDLRKMAERG